MFIINYTVLNKSMPQSSEKREQAPALQEQPPGAQPSRDSGTLSPVKLRNWPHSPSHHLRDAGTYIVTSATYQKVAVFRGADRLTKLTNHVLELAGRYGWSLQAWAIFPNHYHLVGQSEAPDSLRAFVRHLHSVTAILANKWDNTPGRRVWFEFWETRITFPRSYFARLNYVHQNAVRHGLVRVASRYPWCSAAWFERKATRSFFQTVSGFQTEKLNVPDDYEVPSIE
jgi:REP-associated tyrosine transposase